MSCESMEIMPWHEMCYENSIVYFSMNMNNYGAMQLCKTIIQWVVLFFLLLTYQIKPVKIQNFKGFWWWPRSEDFSPKY